MGSHRNARTISPEAFPPEVLLLFDELTGEHTDVWGLAAAIALSRFRKQNSRSPTFAEFFNEVFDLPELSAASRVQWSTVQSSVMHGVRYHIAVHWRRAGWISWARTPRSLRPGEAFRQASRNWRLGGSGSRTTR